MSSGNSGTDRYRSVIVALSVTLGHDWSSGQVSASVKGLLGQVAAAWRRTGTEAGSIGSETSGKTTAQQVVALDTIAERQ